MKKTAALLLALSTLVTPALAAEKPQQPNTEKTFALQNGPTVTGTRDLDRCLDGDANGSACGLGTEKQGVSYPEAPSTPYGI